MRDSQDMLNSYMEEEYERQTVTSEVGFATYRVIDKEFLVGDIFVKPESRHKGHGQELGKALEEIARNSGCIYMSCFVTTNPERQDFVTRKVRCFMDFGFKILKNVGSQIIMTKELDYAV